MESVCSTGFSLLRRGGRGQESEGRGQRSGGEALRDRRVGVRVGVRREDSCAASVFVLVHVLVHSNLPVLGERRSQGGTLKCGHHTGIVYVIHALACSRSSVLNP